MTQRKGPPPASQLRLSLIDMSSSIPSTIVHCIKCCLWCRAIVVMDFLNMGTLLNTMLLDTFRQGSVESRIRALSTGMRAFRTTKAPLRRLACANLVFSRARCSFTTRFALGVKPACKGVLEMACQNMDEYSNKSGAIIERLHSTASAQKESQQSGPSAFSHHALRQVPDKSLLS